eukprot:SAG31_NODE_10011_length_1196_cov_2.779398_2_plen_101_part_00
MVATLRRNQNQICVETPINRMGFGEDMVVRDFDSEPDAALVEETRIQQIDSSHIAMEGCRQRRVDDVMELESPRDGDEVRLATIPQNFGRARAMATRHQP